MYCTAGAASSPPICAIARRAARRPTPDSAASIFAGRLAAGRASAASAAVSGRSNSGATASSVPAAASPRAAIAWRAARRDCTSESVNSEPSFFSERSGGRAGQDDGPRRLSGRPRRKGIDPVNRGALDGTAEASVHRRAIRRPAADLLWYRWERPPSRFLPRTDHEYAVSRQHRGPPAGHGGGTAADAGHRAAARPRPPRPLPLSPFHLPRAGRRERPPRRRPRTASASAAASAPC